MIVAHLIDYRCLGPVPGIPGGIRRAPHEMRGGGCNQRRAHPCRRHGPLGVSRSLQNAPDDRRLPPGHDART